MKKSVYMWMFIIGGLLSASILFDLLEIPEWLSTIISLLAMLGGGVFCSALVSCLIEKQNETRENKRKEAQREYVLGAVKHNFMRLCEREQAELSSYYSKYVLGNATQYRRELIPVEIIARNVYNLLSAIAKKEEKQRKEDKEIVITKESMEMDRIKRYHIATANIPYYEFLLKLLTVLSADFSLLLSTEIFSEKDIEDLKDFISDIESVIMFSSDIDLEDGTILEIKKALFETTDDLLVVLNIPKGTMFSCKYKPVERIQ